MTISSAKMYLRRRAYFPVTSAGTMKLRPPSGRSALDCGEEFRTGREREAMA